MYCGWICTFDVMYISEEFYALNNQDVRLLHTVIKVVFNLQLQQPAHWCCFPNVYSWTHTIQRSSLVSKMNCYVSSGMTRLTTLMQTFQHVNFVPFSTFCTFYHLPNYK